jgi:hypothetical protein
MNYSEAGFIITTHDNEINAGIHDGRINPGVILNCAKKTEAIEYIRLIAG